VRAINVPSDVEELIDKRRGERSLGIDDQHQVTERRTNGWQAWLAALRRISSRPPSILRAC
jgi:hypothetical protein